MPDLLDRPAGGALNLSAACGISGGVLDGRSTRPVIDDRGQSGWRWLLVLEGAGRARDDRGAEHELRPGVLLVRPHGAPHRIERRTDGRWLEFYLRLPGQLAESLIALGLIDPQRRCWSPPDLPALRAAAAAWLGTLVQADDRAATAALLGSTAALIVQAQADGLPAMDERCRRLRCELERDLAAPCAIDAVLRRLGDPDTVRAAFRARHGCTPKQYRIRSRIRAAEALLQAGLPAQDVACRLGWADASAFGRQFRAVIGSPPGRWRRG